MDWSGLVFCSGEKEWYPAATFYGETLCSFGRTRNWTSIDYVHAYLTQALGKYLINANVSFLAYIRFYFRR
jgi:hypothetical protein